VFAGMPAPTNLVVPPYKYLNDTRLRIGDDSKGA
jgi:ubiquinol-cytochrome c reductase iron-sulfur subunit